MYKFSVIIPVFNAEKYLSLCLESLDIKNHKDVQIVLINDGSTDQSDSICRRFKECFPDQIIYIEKQNEGVSAARNDGIRLAAGKFLIFVDADDYVVENYFEYLNEIVSVPADLYVYNYNCFGDYEHTKQTTLFKEGLFKLDSFFCNAIFECLEYQLWNKVFLNSIIKANHLLFNTNMKWCEDLDFWTRYAKSVNLVYMKNLSLYNYRLNENGAVANANINSFSNYHIAYHSQVCLLKHKKALPKAYSYLMQSYIELVGLQVYRCYRNHETMIQLRRTLKQTDIIKDLKYKPTSLSGRFKKVCLKYRILSTLMLYYRIRRA